MINEDELKGYLKEGLTYGEIGKIVGYSKSNVKHYVDKYNLNDLSKYRKPTFNEDYFNKINTKEKAYILGFLLGDSHLSEKYQSMEIGICLDDKCILDFLVKEVGGNIQVDNKLDKKKKKFPNATVLTKNKNIFIDLHKLFGGYLKQDRHIPIISPILERYLIQGFFDAEGCITFGRRKDRNRLWQKVSFTSHLKMLIGIQKILDKNNISSTIRPKSDSNCYVMEFADKERVNTFMNLIYPDDSFIVLRRKYEKVIALRLELGENGES